MSSIMSSYAILSSEASRTRNTALFLSGSQWMLPRVLGFKSLGCDMMMEIFQSCRVSRCCQMARRLFRKLTIACSPSGGAAAVSTEAAAMGTGRRLQPRKTKERKGPENPGKKRPDMYYTLPHQSTAAHCVFVHCGVDGPNVASGEVLSDVPGVPPGIFDGSHTVPVWLVGGRKHRSRSRLEGFPISGIRIGHIEQQSRARKAGRLTKFDK